MIEPSKEGTVPVLGYQLFYRSYGQERGAGTVLCLHGGPGASHEYLSPLADLSQFGYRVVLFDQLACGRSRIRTMRASSRSPITSRRWKGSDWALDLGRVHLMGSSYGGLLALSYALKYQDHLRSLISTGGLASIPLTVAEMRRLHPSCPQRSGRCWSTTRSSGSSRTRSISRPWTCSIGSTSAGSPSGPRTSCGRSRTWAASTR